MQQLRMKWLRAEPKSFTLPDYWRIRNYDENPAGKNRSDVDSWVSICSEGQLGISNASAFKGAILDLRKEGLIPERDLFFICDPTGEPVATAAAYEIIGSDKTGDLHMVAAYERCRGQGIGNVLVNAAVVQFFALGLKNAVLTTDDFRLPAIAAYLTNGFYPVVGGSGIDEETKRSFIERWDEVLRKLGRKSDYLRQ